MQFRRSFWIFASIVAFLLTSLILVPTVLANRLVTAPPYGYKDEWISGPPGSIPYAEARPDVGELRVSVIDLIREKLESCEARATVLKEFDSISAEKAFAISYNYRISGRIWSLPQITPCARVILKIYIDKQVSWWIFTWWERQGECILFDHSYTSLAGQLDAYINEANSGTWQINPYDYGHFRVAAELYATVFRAEAILDGSDYAKVSLTLDQQPPSPPPSGGGCPYLYVWNGTTYTCEGLLNIHDPNGTDVIRQHALDARPQATQGMYLLKLIEHHQTISKIDQVKLFATLSDGRLIQLPLVYARHSEEGNVLPQLLRSDDWKAVTLGADHNNGVSQSITLKFIALPADLDATAFIFQIEGNNMFFKV